MESVGAELEDAAKLAGWGGWPEGELLHQGDFLGFDELLEVVVEFRKFGVVLNGVQ